MQNGFLVGDSHRVEPSLNSVTGPAGTIRLEPKVMQVLVLLAGHAGQVIAKERLIQTVWPDTFVTDDVLTRAISELRRVFGDDVKESRFIQTIPKSGYRLIARVSPSGADQEIAAPGQPVHLATAAAADDHDIADALIELEDASKPIASTRPAADGAAEPSARRRERLAWMTAALLLGAAALLAIATGLTSWLGGHWPTAHRESAVARLSLKIEGVLSSAAFQRQHGPVRSEIGPYSDIIEVVKQISIQDLKATLSAAVAEAEAGHTIIITRHNQAVAQLGPARPPGVHRGNAAVRGRLKPALTRGSKGRYLAVLLEDRGDR